MGEITLSEISAAQCTDAVLMAYIQQERSRVAMATGGRCYRLRSDTAALWVGVLRAFYANGAPQSVRQLFYALETRGIVPKTVKGYRKVCWQVLQMRRQGVIPYGFVADATRWMRKPNSYTGLTAFFQEGKAAYRRALWDNQGVCVEV